MSGERKSMGQKNKMYEDFSKVYDLFMRDIPYDDWASYIEGIWARAGLKPGLVAELGCGTGNITIPLAKKGYEMIGIDLSADMLTVARQKTEDSRLDILYLNQDMREFELFGTVDSIISVCDNLNYILEEDELLEVFRLVKNYLDPSGIFIFDLNTQYKFKHILASNNFCEATDAAAYIWENYFDEEAMINEYCINFFVKAGELYERFQECHYERAYPVKTIEKLLKAAGLKLLHTYDAFTFDKPSDVSERVYFVAN